MCLIEKTGVDTNCIKLPTWLRSITAGLMSEDEIFPDHLVISMWVAIWILIIVILTWKYCFTKYLVISMWVVVCAGQRRFCAKKAIWKWLPTPQNYFSPLKIISHLNKESHLNENGNEAAKTDYEASMSLIPTAHTHFLKFAIMKI